MNPYQMAQDAIQRAVGKWQLSGDVVGMIEGLMPPPVRAVVRGARMIDAGPVADGTLGYARTHGWVQ